MHMNGLTFDEFGCIAMILMTVNIVWGMIDQTVITPCAHARSGVKQSVLVSVVCPAKKIEIYSHKLS